ncbi:hypothetical protein [Leucobacter chromiiresistens]|uniref:Uncharacterized protein n=1 Tax=Leucobacter chromiiresistens TaxID=1079994 RepID=A0A1H1BM86_9MICO|nr:hypothetical protein [Leucobacter chromiiresistens]SDQ53052.1 hypothetical protein SAMN04488565_2916 [Leucobacter chromiiresistens]
MKMDIQFNEDALSKLLQSERAQSALRGLHDNANRIFADALRDREGKSVDQIKSEIDRRIRIENDGNLGEPILTNIATIIHDGRKVWMEADGRVMADD